MLKIVALACATVLTTGCSLLGGGTNNNNTTNDSEKTNDGSATVTSLSLDETEIDMNVGDKRTLTATVSPSDAELTWSSTYPSYATVTDGGVVEALKKGTTTIKVKAGNKTASCKVVVSEVAPTSMSLSKTSVTLEVGDTETLTATFLPENTTNKNVTWSSGTKGVATVSTDGVITAVSEGTAVIKGTSKANSSLVQECTVTVTDSRPKIIPVSNVSLDKTTLTMEVNTTATLIATVLPDNATDKSIVWSSNNSKVSVANGVLQAGSAITTSTAVTITAKSADGKKSATCKVTVVDTPLINNEKFTKENEYICIGQHKFVDSDEKDYDIHYTFKTDGNLTVENKKTSSLKNATYRISDGMIYVTYTNSDTEMFFYYDNIIVSASSEPLILTRNGSAVSTKSSSTMVGYFAIIEVNVGDAIETLTGSAGSKGYYVKLMENGTFASSKSYMNWDQITYSIFNTAVPKEAIIKFTIGTKQYNCLFIVRA